MHYTKHFKFCSKDIRSSCPDPVITRRKLNVHSTFRRETINLPPGEKCSKNEEYPQKNTSEIFETLIL